jgi:high-affinity iron transporter
MLSEQQRWSLAFYVGQQALSREDLQAGPAALSAHPAHPLKELGTLTTLTPAEADSQFGATGRALMAQLRLEPAPLFSKPSPLGYAQRRLEESLTTYRHGDAEAAYRIAVDAYLEGFELVEPGLDAVAPELRLSIEGAMTELRTGFRDGAPSSLQQQRADALYELLDQAQARLDGTSLSGSAAFASAFLILLREGLEALLVVAALAAFLIKTERRDGLPYLHLGWGAALLLGVGTWFLASNFIAIGGEQRELTEGIAAVVAALMLFYVGFWLHSKTHALHWKHFIEGSVKKALGTGSLWALAGLSFIAVYREVFETILFYQALWLQVDVGGRSMALSGVGAAVAVLVVLAWVILRYSTRLPLRQFFGVTGIFMFVLAVVFAGKGVAALQEAGKLPVNPIEFPRVELLGIYPNLQSLAFQLALIALAVFLIIGRNRLAPTPSQG